MASAHKKVILRRFLGDVLPGYLAAGRVVERGSVSLMDLQGRLCAVPLNDVKYVAYVRDFNLSDNINPEKLTRRSFLARPRSEGLWIRLHFRTSAASATDPRAPNLLEGLASADVSFLDELLADAGIHLTPPDTRSNTQRLFIPRSSIADLELLAVITSPSRKKPAASAVSELQDNLFHLSEPTPS